MGTRKAERRKRILLIGIIVLIVVLILFLFLSTNKKKKNENNIGETTVQSDNNQNISEALKKPRNELEYYVSNIYLEKQDAETIIKMKLTNNGESTINAQLVDIVFLDKDRK